MAGTFSQIYIQIIFAVQNREALIMPNWKEELYKYITGIVQNKGQKMITINGTSTHLHIFIGMKPNYLISDLVREIKKLANAYFKEHHLPKFKFEWQGGYDAFSYSPIDNVVKYIANQKGHHQRKTFKDEYLDFLKKYAVEYKNDYLFEWNII